MKDLIQVLKEKGQFTHFIDVIERAGINTIILTAEEYTVFAPIDEAFEESMAGVELSNGQTSDGLKAILQQHFVRGKYDITQLKELMTLESLNGQMLLIDTLDGDILINEAQVTEGNIEIDNGLVHAIDMVLMPAQPLTMDNMDNDGQSEVVDEEEKPDYTL